MKKIGKLIVTPFIYLIAFEQFMWQTLRPWARYLWLAWQGIDVTLATIALFIFGVPTVLGVAGIGHLTDARVPVWVWIGVGLMLFLGWLVSLAITTLAMIFATASIGIFVLIVAALVFDTNLLELATVPEKEKDSGQTAQSHMCS